MLIEEMPDVEPNKRASDYDTWRMFYSIGTNVTVYMEKHSDRYQPYIILIDRTSGKRIKITFQEEGKKK